MSVVIVSVEGGGDVVVLFHPVSVGPSFNIFFNYRDATPIVWIFLIISAHSSFVNDQRPWCFCVRTKVVGLCNSQWILLKWENAEKKTTGEVDQCFWLYWRVFKWEKISSADTY